MTDLTEPVAAGRSSRVFGDWNLRGCARHGHITYAPDESDLRERLHVITPAGEAWRCLRCWAYVPGPPVGGGPADLAPEVPRGAALRDRVIMRALAVERWLRALLLFAASFAVYRFERAQQGLADATDQALPALRPIAERLGWNIDNSWLVQEAQRALHAEPGTLSLLMVALAAYGCLQVVEGVGLWLMRRWGEYFAVVATSAFIPLEVYEVVHHTSALKVTALLINIAAVVWLVLSKHLFGARGGWESYEAMRRSASLLQVEAAAARPEVRGPVAETPTTSDP